MRCSLSYAAHSGSTVQLGHSKDSLLAGKNKTAPLVACSRSSTNEGDNSSSLLGCGPVTVTPGPRPTLHLAGPVVKRSVRKLDEIFPLCPRTQVESTGDPENPLLVV